jgi:hypothetical protein
MELPLLPLDDKSHHVNLDLNRESDLSIIQSFWRKLYSKQNSSAVLGRIFIFFTLEEMLQLSQAYWDCYYGQQQARKLLAGVASVEKKHSLSLLANPSGFLPYDVKMCFYKEIPDSWIKSLRFHNQQLQSKLTTVMESLKPDLMRNEDGILYSCCGRKQTSRLFNRPRHKKELSEMDADIIFNRYLVMKLIKAEQTYRTYTLVARILFNLSKCVPWVIVTVAAYFVAMSLFVSLGTPRNTALAGGYFRLSFFVCLSLVAYLPMMPKYQRLEDFENRQLNILKAKIRAVNTQVAAVTNNELIYSFIGYLNDSAQDHYYLNCVPQQHAVTGHNFV